MFKKQSKTSVAQQDQVVQYVMMCNKPTVLKQSKVLRNKQQNPRDSSCSASFISVPMQDSTDEEVFSEDVPNQNLWCIFCDGDFSADSQGEVWVMCVPCHFWAHEACACSKRKLCVQFLSLTVLC